MKETHKRELKRGQNGAPKQKQKTKLLSNNTVKEIRENVIHDNVKKRHGEWKNTQKI